LLWAQYTITGDKRAQSAVNYFFKNFGESSKYGYWPIIVRDLREVILGMGVICAIFRRLGNSPFGIRLLKNSDNHEDKLLAEIFQNFAGMSKELDVVLHFSDAIICLISSALVGGNVHKLGKDSTRKSLKVAGGGSILEDIFLPISEKCLFSSSRWF